ncbi:MAG: Indole-3-glycerol phosphate synthase [Verrucomicrobiota bacterium]|jgi:indole-3-glycerol phosphate synthase
MTFKDILTSTAEESKARQERYSLREIQRKIDKMGPTRGFARALERAPFSVIAEIKRKSPSMGEINPLADEVAVPIYHSHDFVSAISVLTQETHFGGTPQILRKVRERTQCRPKPILRKDFIFSEYEVYFSRFMGADAILLMANVVEDAAEFKKLHDLALGLGMDVLCEVHDPAEIARLPDTARVCGINSRKFRNAKQKQGFLQGISKSLGLASKHKADTRTDLSVFDLVNLLPKNCIKVAESGISRDNLGEVVSRYPFDAALVGTSLLSSALKKGPYAANAIANQLDELRTIYQSVNPANAPAAKRPLTHSGKSKRPVGLRTEPMPA